jgi:hypothetical protein
MHRLPSSVSQALSDIVERGDDAAQTARGIAALLDADLSCTDLSRSVEAFRESSRSLGILEEARNGQKVYDAWCKLARFFADPIEKLGAAFAGEPTEGEIPEAFETLASRWDRTAAELAAFIEEERGLDRLLLAAPVSAHVGHNFRSKILLLDKRAERLRVALELLHRDIALAVRGAARRLAGGAPATDPKARKAPGGGRP